MMKRLTCFFMAIIFLLSDVQLYPQHHSAITYYANHGERFGDKLCLYVRTRWLAHKHGLRFLYQPFKYSDELMLHTLDEHIYIDPILTHQIQIKNDTALAVMHPSALYVTHFFCQDASWESWEEVMTWHNLLADTEFMKELKQRIAPRNSITLPPLPTDKITVALHVRKGGGYDAQLASEQIFDPNVPPIRRKISRSESADVEWPLKFPPDQYYLDQIKRLHEMVKGAPLYIHIFTDDPNPADIARRYAHELQIDSIVFDYRPAGNKHDSNVLEDFFNIAQYDCLIRSGSNFAQMAQLIGNHKIVIYPKAAHWKAGRLIVHDVGVWTTAAQDSSWLNGKKREGISYE